MRLSRPFVALGLCLIALCCAAPPAGATSLTAGGVRVGGAPQLPVGASLAGAVAPERQLNLYVALEPPDPAGLENFAEEVSTPGSPLHGDFLSVPQFAERFGADPAQVATVRAALAARGLQVGAPSANGLSLPVTATAAEAEAAFATPIDRVETASGRVAFANRSAPQVPAAAAPFVAGVIGLDDLTLAQRQTNPIAGTASSTAAGPTASVPADPAASVSAASTPTAGPTTSVLTGGPQPCAEALSFQSAVGLGYTADQIASAYNLTGYYAGGDLGAGQTIALLEFEPFGEADVAAYQACYGTHTEVAAVNIEGGSGTYKRGEDGESALDIEQLIGLAPAAKILVYQAPNPDEVGILSAWVADDTAKVMSSSWGICEKRGSKTEETVVDTLLQEAAAQGQSFFAASGDSGSTGCYESRGIDKDKSLAADFPAADPFATGVGGTQMETAAPPPLQYIWNDTEIEGAGGGGVSSRFPMPAYQQAANPALNVIGPLSSGAPCGAAGDCREVPDVSADAAPRTGYIVHTQEEWQLVGGTSAAAPLWAALTALADASPTCAGRSIGFANPSLYALAGVAYAGNLEDVTAARPGGPPTTDFFSSAGPYAAGPYYDMATGLGTPVGTALGATLCELIPPPAPAPAPPAPAAPAPAPGPTPARVRHAHLGGVADGRLRLTATLAAREGGRLGTIALTVPPGLVPAHRRWALAAAIVVRDEDGRRLKFSAHTTGRTIHIRLLSPQPTVQLLIAPPALTVTPKLAARARSGRASKLGLLIAVRESAGHGARLPLSLAL